MTYFSTNTGFDATTLDFNLPLTGNATLIGSNTALPVHFILRPHLVATGPLTQQISGAHDSYPSRFQIASDVGQGHSAYGNGFTFDPSGMISGGTVQSLSVTNWAFSTYWQASGISLNATDYAAALASADRADDQALVAGLLTGQDYVRLSHGDDTFDAGIGRDLILGFAGVDRLFGGHGNDLINGGISRDRMEGGLGADLIFGGQGEDHLYGGQGRDTLAGGTGFDTMTGGGGADCFLFIAAGPNEIATITDFEQGRDQIWIIAAVFGGELGFGSLNIANVQGGASIGFGDPARGNVQSIYLSGVTAANLTAADFNFSPEAELAASGQAFYHHWSFVG